MKIAIDVRELNETAGMKKMLLDLLLGLMEKDKKNEYFLLGEDNISFTEKLPLNFSYIKARYLNMSIWTNIFIPIFLKKNKIDIYFNPVNSHTPLFIPCKYIWMLHDIISILYPSLNNADENRKKDIKLGIKKADKIITVSQNSKKDIIKTFNINEKKISVILNAISLKNFNTFNKEQNKIIKNKYNLNCDYLLCIGILEPRKNIEFILEIFYELTKDEKKKDLKLVLTDHEKKITSNIKEKIKKLELNDKIIFTGYIDDTELPYVYKNAKIFLYPSLYEGFGLPVLEAMSLEVPLICSNTSSLPEIVDDAGILLDPYDKQIWIENINSLLDNENLKKELIEKGKKRIEKFNQDERIDKFIEEFNNL